MKKYRNGKRRQCTKEEMKGEKAVMIMMMITCIQNYTKPYCFWTLDPFIKLLVTTRKAIIHSQYGCRHLTTSFRVTRCSCFSIN